MRKTLRKINNSQSNNDSFQEWDNNKLILQDEQPNIMYNNGSEIINYQAKELYNFLKESLKKTWKRKRKERNPRKRLFYFRTVYMYTSVRVYVLYCTYVIIYM